MSIGANSAIRGAAALATTLLGAWIVLGTVSTAAADVSDCTGKPAGMACLDDGVPCTRDLCDGFGVCTHPSEPNLTPCPDDGNECTRDMCDGSGVCTHPALPNLSPCTDEGNECTRDFCNPAGLCTHPNVPNLSPCEDDGDACTRDFCDPTGLCTHPNVPNLSPCEDDGDACTRDFCDVTGTCTHPPVPDQSPCGDDGKPCTVDMCVGGTCSHSGPTHCQNNCAADPDGTRCADEGNPCTTDVCQAGICTHLNRGVGTPCTDEPNDCTFEQCDGAGTCSHLALGAGAACADEANDCTFEQCSGGGTCQHLALGIGAACADEANDCTFEQCNGGGTCQHLSIATGSPCFDDGSDCTLEYCNGGGVCLHLPLGVSASCNDDSDDCTIDQCNGATLCNHTAISACVTPLQSSSQVKCITGLNGAAAKMSAAQGKGNSACIKNAVKGDELTPQSCLTADTNGKVAAAATKVADVFSKSCSTVPSFGAYATAPILASADNERVSALADLFGDTLNDVIATEATGKCQATVEATLEKIVNAKLKSFVQCKKSGLMIDIHSRLGLDQCLMNVATAAADPLTSLGKTIAKLTSGREKSCAGVDIATAFPGDCADAGNTAAFDTCVDRIAECRACRIIVAVDAPFQNCDIFDDGIGNGSCPVD